MKIFTINRFKNRCLLTVFKNNPFINGHMRANIYKKLMSLDIGNNCFIGKNVHLDDLHLDKIKIGNNVMITQNSSFLTHFYDIKYSKEKGVHEFYTGELIIHDNVFIGMNSIIVKPLTIFRGAVIGAGVVLSNDVPENSIVTNVTNVKTMKN